MVRVVRRMLWLALLGGAAAFAARWWAARSVPVPATTPSWPPFEPPAQAPTEPVVEPVPEPVVERVVHAAAEVPRWVLPVDGQCPDGYPVKANDNSGIYHVPGGRFYERTKPERCYVDAESAAADGYRAAKA
ncbi:MAG: hypothetical protein U0Q03_10875 [Acidimicrobiales bacterium]